MGSVAHMGHNVFRVTPYQTRLVVLMGNTIGNGGMYLFNIAASRSSTPTWNVNGPNREVSIRSLISSGNFLSPEMSS